MNNRANYDWVHKFKTKISGINSAHMVIITNPSFKDEKLEYILNSKLAVIDFLDSAIRWDYSLPRGWTKKKLTGAHKDAVELDWENFWDVKDYIIKYVQEK